MNKELLVLAFFGKRKIPSLIWPSHLILKCCYCHPTPKLLTNTFLRNHRLVHKKTDIVRAGGATWAWTAVSCSSEDKRGNFLDFSAHFCHDFQKLSEDKSFHKQWPRHVRSIKYDTLKTEYWQIRRNEHHFCFFRSSSKAEKNTNKENSVNYKNPQMACLTSDKRYIFIPLSRYQFVKQSLDTNKRQYISIK